MKMCIKDTLKLGLRIFSRGRITRIIWAFHYILFTLALHLSNKNL